MSTLIKGLLVIFWLLAVPWVAGGTVLYKNEKKSPGMCLLAGYLLMLSVTEVLTLPMIWAKLPLHILKYSFAGVMAAFALIGIILLHKEHKDKKLKKSGSGKNRRISVYFLAAAVLILFQLAAASFLAHMDADDAFYVATATTAVHTDTIFSVNPYTGYDYVHLPSRYVLSPFPIFLAVISSLCGFHPAIVAHVIFPALFIFMAYVVLYQYAKKWFPEGQDARGIFMIFCTVIIWFSGYSIYNSENFQMIRIWQGKACMAAVFLPLLLYLGMCIIMEKQKEYSWIMLLMADISCCLLSSMGIMLACIMLVILLIMGLVRYRDLQKAACTALCCLPSLLLGAVYIMIR